MDFVFGSLASAGSKMLGMSLEKLFGPGREVEVPLTDDIMAKIAVVPTVGALAATSRDAVAEGVFVDIVDDVPVPIQTAMQDHLDYVKPMMYRCPCHASEPELGTVWVHKKISLDPGTRGSMTGEGFVRKVTARSLRVFGPLNDQTLTVADDLYLCLPFLCKSVYAAELMPPIHLGDAVAVPSRRLAYFSDTTGVGCQLPPGVKHEYEHAAVDSDALGNYAAVRGLHKIEYRSTDLNCMICHPNTVHGFTEAFFDNKKTPDRRWSAARGMLHLCITLNALWVQAGCPPKIQLTAWDGDYMPFESAHFFEWPAFVIVKSQADAGKCREHGVTPVLADIVTSGSHWLANIRVWAACAMPVGVTVHVTNWHQYVGWILDLTVPPVAAVETHGRSKLNAIVNSCFITSGAVQLGRVAPLTIVSRFMAQYGLEEACLARIDGQVSRVDHTWNNWDMEHDIYPGCDRMYPLVMRSLVTNKFAIARGSRRGNLIPFIRIIKRWMRRTEPTASWTTAWNLPIGAWTDPGPSEIFEAPRLPMVRPGAPKTLGGAISAYCQVVNWFVFGSYGDVVPVLALARRMRGFGVDVNVIRTHSEKAGQEILAFAEKGNLIRAAPEFLRTMSVAATAPGVVFGPPEFSSVDLGISLRPPPSVIFPADFGAGHLINFVIESVLRGWAPIMSIGAYHGVSWLPRSADGLHFLKSSKNTERPIDIMVAWGSSTLPVPDIANAVLALPGDHYSQFEKAKFVVTHGGAGTVQTAAAAGARVIAGTAILDRRYRDVLDAGRGVQPGSDPDACMLTLLHMCPLVWIWAWKHSYRMFWRALRLGLLWVIMPSIWVVLALAVKSVIFVIGIPRVRVVFTLSFISTVAATLLMPIVGSWWAMLLGPQLESLAYFCLNHLGLTWAAASVTLAQGLASVSRNPVLWAVIVSGHTWAALPTAWMVGYFQVIPLLTTEVLNVLFGGSVTSEHKSYVKIGVSWAWQDSNIPAFHTRFISPDETEVIEGTWVTGYRGLGALYSIRKKPMVDDIPCEWRLETRLPWAHISDMRPLTASYSTFWNCQSAMLYISRGCWVLLGMSLFVLMPMGLWMLIALVCITVIAGVVTVLLEVVPILTLLMTACGLGRYIPLVSTWLWHHLDSLVQAESGWFPTAMSVLVGISSGWAESYQTHPLMTQILFAQSRQELDEIRWSQFSNLTRLEVIMLESKYRGLNPHLGLRSEVMFHKNPVCTWPLIMWPECTTKVEAKPGPDLWWTQFDVTECILGFFIPW